MPARLRSLDGTCKNGHSRADHTRTDKRGHHFCHACRLATTMARNHRIRGTKGRPRKVGETRPPIVPQQNSGHQWLHNWRWNEDEFDFEMEAA